MTDIAWDRIAVPQEDGYDTEVTERLALERYGWSKQWPTSGPTWLDGGVMLIEPSGADEVRDPADATHPNLAVAETILRAGYPAMYMQCRQLLQKLYVYQLRNIPIDVGGVGVSCGPEGDLVSFEIGVSINSGIGIIEGVVHEIAHNKMKAHGISFHHWDRLLQNEEPTKESIENGKGEHLYSSSVRKDLLRPIGACLSAHYSYLYVTDTLLHLVESNVIGPPENYIGWIAMQRDRVVQGKVLIDDHVRPDSDGELYFGSMQEWALQIDARTERIVAATADILKASGKGLSHSGNDNSGNPYHGDAFIAD